MVLRRIQTGNTSVLMGRDVCLRVYSCVLEFEGARACVYKKGRVLFFNIMCLIITFGLTWKIGPKSGRLTVRNHKLGVKPQHCSEPYAKPMSCPSQGIQQQLFGKALR